jgi:hypothetical protein
MGAEVLPVDGNRIMFCVIFIGVGGLFALIGIALLSGTISFLRRSVRTTGTVVGHMGDDQQKGWVQMLLPPIVEFTDEGEKTYRVAITERDKLLGCAVGARIPIRYNRNNPGEVRRPSMIWMWLVPLMFAGVGLLALVIGVLVWILQMPVQGPI